MLPLKLSILAVDNTWFHTLLPIRAMTFTMRFTEASHPGFFHQAALSAWLRTILGSPNDDARYMCSNVLEQGKQHFSAGETYRFTVFAMGDQGRDILARLPEAMMATKNNWDKPITFRDNWCLQSVEHGASGEQIPHIKLQPEDVPVVFDVEMLKQDIAYWRQHRSITMQFHAPWRVLRSQNQRGSSKGELRYCRDVNDLSDNGLWLTRVDDSLRRLAEDIGVHTPPRTSSPLLSVHLDLFWVDASYKNQQRRVQPMGGLLGEICIQDSSKLSDESLALLIIGQYLGVGQRRVFGNGRYRLLGEDRVGRLDNLATCGWLKQAMKEENLQNAWHKVNDSGSETDEFFLADEHTQVEDISDRKVLLRCAGRLLRGEYQPPSLHGFVHEDADGGLRPLAAPPLTDRILQRAVQQVLAPALDAMMADVSYGYRTGRSRFQVRDLIQRFYREGYCWVFESDIHSFFDTISWKKLRVRLGSLLMDQSLTDAIMAWMQASVNYRGVRIDRQAGLPQGSPLSPVLANLMLDDFDRDLGDAGCQLIRFADDFVIVAKSKKAAEYGGALAVKALLDVELTLNREKTRTVPFSQGFRFLGFLFVDGMAVECKPQKSMDAGKPPPQSWLARAASLNDKGSSKDEQLRGSDPVELVPYEDRGQVLIFCGESAMLFTRGGRACIEREDKCLLETPWNHLDAIVLFGRHHITTPAMFDALAHDVPIHLATGSGHYRGMVFNPSCAAAGELWIQQQQLFSDHSVALAAAKSVVDARIRHMRENLRRREVEAHAAISAMNGALHELERVDSRQQLNGVEGHATRCYFQVLQSLVPEAYGFHGRVRRPPTDPFNALLSLGYTYLYAHVDTLLRAEGLLPEKGFYHQSRSGHAALASDLMEPFRHVVERCALSMVQRGKLGCDDFSMQGKQGCRMSATGRRIYLAALSTALLTPVKASGGGEPLPILDHIHQQILAVKLWVAGKMPRFSAWRMR